MFNIEHDDSVGTFKAGFWYEWGRNLRYNYYLDYNPSYVGPILPGGTVDTTKGGNNAISPGYYAGYAYTAHSYLTTTQPFVEYNWHITSSLSLLGGIKYYDLKRDYQSPLGQGPKVPLYFAHDYTKPDGSLMLNYKINSQTSAYAQIAQGFSAPDLTYFQLPNIQSDQIKPQTTVNYQTGVVYKNQKFNADADFYYINVQNTIVAIPNPADQANPIYSSSGSGIVYSGAEAEATYYLGYGTSIYANGSLNRAEFKNSKYDVNGVPSYTGAAGVLYSDKNGLFSSLVNKWVGPNTQYSSLSTPNVSGSAGLIAKGGSYNELSFAVGYSHKLNYVYFKSYKVKFQVENLLNKEIQALAGVNSSGVQSYTVFPKLNAYLTISGEF